MKFSTTRDLLLKPLQLVTGVVEKRQTLPVLANLLLEVKEQTLLMTGTDLEVQLAAKIALDTVDVEGEITLPAKKMLEICRSLPEGAAIRLELQDQRAIIKSGRSRFVLSTLPASDFPNVELAQDALQFSIDCEDFKYAMNRTAFSMAQQDVRYYLNGILLEISANQLRAVATDGHRLATCWVTADITSGDQQVIVPRKGVLELTKLLSEGQDSQVRVSLSANNIRIETEGFEFTSKLVDGKFPDYHRVIPKNGDKVLIADRQELRNVLSRAAILSNEKYRGIRLQVQDQTLRVMANNPEQEEAEDQLAVDYQGGEAIEVGFNVSYLLDILNHLSSEQVKLVMLDANSSTLVEEVKDRSDALYVVMPMRL